MSVLRRGKSKNWYVQFQIGGRTIIKSSRSTSRKVAEQMETQLRAQVHAGIYLGHKPAMAFGEALARFASSNLRRTSERYTKASSQVFELSNRRRTSEWHRKASDQVFELNNRRRTSE
jgi:hypothetical protein